MHLGAGVHVHTCSALSGVHPEVGLLGCVVTVPPFEEPSNLLPGSRPAYPPPAACEAPTPPPVTQVGRLPLVQLPQWGSRRNFLAG